MLRSVLNQKQVQILKEERAALGRLQTAMAGSEASAEDQITLRDSLRQLDELFLLVVVGEFNSGKSALINALLGERIFPEGVTPTTDRLNLLCHGNTATQEINQAGIMICRHPAEFLREINIVDTPGTNAVIRRHEQLTQDFIPRSDLVIFVTSADRPFTESERAFLERIRTWGKKVIIVLNKIDLLNETETEEVIEYIRKSSFSLLGFSPEIFPVASRHAMQAKQADGGHQDAARKKLWASSRFEALETYILKTLDEKSRICLKLESPLGVGEQLAGRLRGFIGRKLELLAEDLVVIGNIENQLKSYQIDMQHDFRFRTADIEKILLAMENRGMLFFDETVRLPRIFDLMNTQRIQGEFERKVVSDTPLQIEQEISGLIDWVVERDLRQWQAILDYLENHLAQVRDEQGRIIGKVGGSFEYNRRKLLDSVGRAARDVVRSYNKEVEAKKLASGVRNAVAGLAVVEVGAVGLGVVLVSVLNTALLDFTGILAAGSLAVVGLLILPAKKRRAKADLSSKLEKLRSRLVNVMGDEFDHEMASGVQRLRETIAPYTRFVRAEQEKLSQIDGELGEVGALIAKIRLMIKNL